MTNTITIYDSLKGYPSNLSNDFRKVITTGRFGQFVTMSLKPKEDIGMEVHHNTDQFFYIISGTGQLITSSELPVMAGHYSSKTIARGQAFLIPAGTYHNIINTSYTNRLQLIAVYSAAPHPVGTVHKTKQDAMKAEY